MTNSFVNAMTNVAYTENGALSNRSTGNDVLEFYYHAAARRGQNVTGLFNLALAENKPAAIVAAFNLRDVRGGKGERQSFRDCMTALARSDADTFAQIMPLIPEYGRWDDLLPLMDDQADVVLSLIKDQLRLDMENMQAGKSVSLLAKWLPSINAGKASRAEAKRVLAFLGMRESDYRKMLSQLRAHIDVVERKMCAGEWTEIDYEKVPSRAAKIYKDAFRKHDEDGYASFLTDVEAGKKTIKASTLFPYELVMPYLRDNKGVDRTLEALWKALPDYTGTNESALVVADVSGSMFSPDEQPISVSVALAIYFAERNKGAFQNTFITFSAIPTFFVVKGETLHDKVNEVCSAHWDMNTDLQAVFSLILGQAKKFKVAEEDMPKAVYIVSDMQFDSATGRNSMTNFEAIEQQYAESGYERPVLVFWNVASRVNETPVTKDQQGTVLVSGLSQSVFKAAVTRQDITPMDAMMEVLQGERYLPVWKALGVEVTPAA